MHFKNSNLNHISWYRQRDQILCNSDLIRYFVKVNALNANIKFLVKTPKRLFKKWFVLINKRILRS